MSFIHFTDWFKKEPIELAGFISEKKLTKVDIKKRPEILDILQKMFGPLVEEKDVNLDNGFFKKANDTMNILRDSNAYKVIDPKWLDTLKKNADVPVENDFITIHISDKSIKTTGDNDDPNTLKNIILPLIGDKATELQEVIQSIIMELNVKNIKVHGHKTFLLPMPLDKKGNPVTYKRSNLEEWMLSSDPDAKTGLCAFINFGDIAKGNGEQLRKELETFFLRGTNKWYKVFDKLYEANIRQLIDSVFKVKIHNWDKALFCHHRNITLNPMLQETLNKYLGKTRLKGKKDNVDKSDIVLMFSDTLGNKIMNDAMNANSLDEHNMILNDAFCKKQLIGISLKKIVENVNIMAANFNPTTTAVGDAIKPDKSICIEYHGRDKESMKLNTFGPVNDSDVIIPKKNDGKSSGIILTLNNKKHIHCDSDNIKFDIRSGGSSMKYEFREEGHPAFGNAALPLARSTKEGYPGINTSIENEIKSGAPFTEIIVNKSKEIAQIFKLRPQSLAYTFGEAAGYPVKVIDNTGEVVKITNAPYLKLY